MKAAVTIDKRTGEFIDYIDDRSDEDKERHVQHAKSPYTKGHTKISEKTLVIK